jgi:hypothetical protein
MPIKPKEVASDFRELYVAAGKPITLEFSSGDGGPSMCIVNGSFVPESGKDYEANMLISPSERKCFFRLSQLGEPPLPIKVKPASWCGGVAWPL